jgi:CBS domain-containing protein
MSLHAFIHAEVETVAPGTTVADAARLMGDRNVGSLIVEAGGKPIGILTDRDIVMRVVAVGSDAGTVTVEEVMTRHPVTLAEELSLFEALEIMKDEGVRRFPVIDPEGNLSGFFSVDDVLQLLGLQLSALASIVGRDIG